MGRPFPKPAPVSTREMLAYVIVAAFVAAVLAGALTGPREPISPDFTLATIQGN